MHPSIAGSLFLPYRSLLSRSHLHRQRSLSVSKTSSNILWSSYVSDTTISVWHSPFEPGFGCSKTILLLAQSFSSQHSILSRSRSTTRCLSLCLFLHAVSHIRGVMGKLTWLRQSSYNEFSIVRVIQVGVVVLLSFAVLWAPFLSVKQMWQVLHRVFPMSRGLYEVRSDNCNALKLSIWLQDKVASFWCVVSPIYKFSRWPIGLVAKMR